jgi:hypothetical protein
VILELQLSEFRSQGPYPGVQLQIEIVLLDNHRFFSLSRRTLAVFQLKRIQKSKTRLLIFEECGTLSLMNHDTYLVYGVEDPR